jgi:glycerol-1-phosphate dehydrogenase [NAD(P)+]
VSVEQIVIGNEAADKLVAFLDDAHWRRVLIVDDPNTAEVAGDELSAALNAAGHTVTRHQFLERSDLLADQSALNAVRNRLETDEPDGAIAVGSGVINDVTRYATFLERRPYIAFPTAASMDGYASNVAAMQFDGLKLTFAAHAPRAIFADPAVLASAPKPMTIWGLGDLLGKATAHFDWRLARGLFGEHFCPEVEDVVARPMRRATQITQALCAGDPVALGELIDGLILSGIAMSMFGNSRPASGCEHHASHFWDLLAFRGMRPHHPHGLQVGYATRFALRIQRAALARIEEIAPPFLTVAQPSKEEAAWIGPDNSALAEVRRDKERALDAASTSAGEDLMSFANVRTLLDEAEQVFDEVDAALATAGFPLAVGFAGVDEAALRATFRYANRLRSRYSVLSLLESQRALKGIDDEIVSSTLIGDHA